VAYLAGYGAANTTGVEELFVQLLHFLVVVLDFEKHCVCIRKGALKAANKEQFKHKHPPQVVTISLS
jgi:hypothetical protein